MHLACGLLTKGARRTYVDFSYLRSKVPNDAVQFAGRYFVVLGCVFCDSVG